MPYIGTSPSNSVRRVHTYTATASQTTFTGASSEGVTLSYADTNYIDVFQNGVLLGSDDYTATSGTSVVLSQSASSSDLVVIICYDVFSVADTVSKTNGGSFDSAVTMSGGISGNTSISGDLTVDTNTLKVDSSNNRVGIGTASPSSTLTVDGTTAFSTLELASTSGSATSAFMGVTSGSDLAIKVNGSERMRIDSNGHLMLNTSTARTGTNSITLEGGNSFFMFRATGTGSLQQASFFRNTDATPSQVGSIFTSSVGTSYNQTSDYRLKENVNYSFDATTRLKKLKPARFNFIIDADTTVDGFLAHEVSDIVPEAITGEKDAVDADGNIDPQGIDQSKIVPLLTKALQEQQATIEALEARITALENAE